MLSIAADFMNLSGRFPHPLIVLKELAPSFPVPMKHLNLGFVGDVQAGFL